MYTKDTDGWHSGLVTGNMVGMVFIYLKNAFDTVDHEVLCKKLKYYSVQERDLALFVSYLSIRMQYCRVNGVDSKMENIEVGMPQGSCFAPFSCLR